MRTLLVALTIVEIVLVLAVLVGYLVAVAASLRRSAVILAKVSFGVRAIETQTQAIGAHVPELNKRLTGLSHGLGDLARLAAARSSGVTGGR